MRILLIVVLGLFAGAAACTTNAQEPRAGFLRDHLKKFVLTDAPLIAITNVRVVSGDGSETKEDQTIIIRDGQIEQIGSSVRIPDQVEIVEGEASSRTSSPSSTRSPPSSTRSTPSPRRSS